MGKVSRKVVAPEVEVDSSNRCLACKEEVDSKVQRR